MDKRDDMVKWEAREQKYTIEDIEKRYNREGSGRRERADREG